MGDDDDDEVICLDNSEDELQSDRKRSTLSRDRMNHSNHFISGAAADNVLLISSDSDNVESLLVRSNNRGIKKRKPIKKELDAELLSLSSSDDNSNAFITALSKKSKRLAPKIKLPKSIPTSTKLLTNEKDEPSRLSPEASTSTSSQRSSSSGGGGGGSPSKSPNKSPKKKKTLADIVTDIHLTSTDEIDSDEINESQAKLKVDLALKLNETQQDEPQPCCSKSLLIKNQIPSSSPVKVTQQKQSRSRPVSTLISSDEDELPDIDEGYAGFKKLNLQSSQSSIKKDNSRSSLTTMTSELSAPCTQPSTSSSRVSKKPKNTDADLEIKRQEKEAKRLQREKKKEEEARLKELKKADNELIRQTKPGAAFKFMTVILDESIAIRLDALVPQLVAADIKYQLETNPMIDNSITFQRELVHRAMDDNLQLQIVSKFQQEDQLMIILESDKVVPMIEAQLKSTSSDCGINLTAWVESIKSSSPGKKITLFLYNFEKYFKKVQKNTQQEYRNRILNADEDQPQKKKRKNKAVEIPIISRTELQSAFIEMQLSTGVNYRFIKNVSELGACIIHYTKSIADTPFKKQRVELQGFDWFAMGETAGSVKVDKDGNGLKKLWVDQLLQFSSVGIDVANAIANKYPSPTTLLKAYEKCKNQLEGQNLLQSISVTSGVGPLARTRKVGPELSKKMYRFFTSTNGDRFLGSTSDMR